MKRIMIKRIIIALIIISAYLFVVTNAELPVYTIESIKQFDGSDPNKPIYIGYDGNVYDVSPGRDAFYGPNKAYNYLTGKDSTTELNIAGGSIIKNKYKIVGILKKWLELRQ